MDSKQNQLYKFNRGDSNIYNRNKIAYQFDNTYLLNNYRDKPGISFDSVPIAYLKCDAFCKGCKNGKNISQKINCRKCSECMTSSPTIMLKPLPRQKYPRFPKKKPLIPTPFPYLQGSHNTISRIIPLKQDVPTSRKLNAVSTSAGIPCSDYCDTNVCEQWNMQNQLYQECQNWNDENECRKRFGCKQWEGHRYRLTPPLHPHLTDCEACWVNDYTNI